MDVEHIFLDHALSNPVHKSTNVAATKKKSTIGLGKYLIESQLMLVAMINK